MERRAFWVGLALVLTLVFAVSFPCFADGGGGASGGEKDTITIVTYYPSPYGAYNQLVTRTLGVGDNDDHGHITSADAPNLDTNPNDLWVAGKVGIGTIEPGVKLDVAGEVKIGNSSTVCSSTNEGAIRYNSTSKATEVCDGSSWKAMGGVVCAL